MGITTKGKEMEKSITISTIHSLEIQGVTFIPKEYIRRLYEYRNGELKFFEAVELLRNRGIEVTGIKEKKKRSKNEKT
jgi:hypothetical protein